MKTLFRSPIAQAAVAMIAVLSTGASLSADEPAENAVQTEAEKVTKDLDQKLQELNRVYHAQLATSFDGFIGIEVSPPDDVLRSHLGLAEGRGLVVTNVIKGGPAALAGIQVNDVLITVGGKEIDGVDKLRQLLEASKDKPVSVAFLRGGRRQAVELTPHPLADISKATQYLRYGGAGPAYAEEPKYWLGVGLAGADDALRSHLGIEAGEGLVVTGIESDSPAAKAGVMTNDLLLKLEGKPLKTIEELAAQLQEIKDKSVALELLRRGKPATLTVTPEVRSQASFLAHYVSNYDNGVLSFIVSQAADVSFEQTTLTSSELSLLQQAELSAQVNALLEQARQLQASAEALQAIVNAQPQTPPSDK